MTLALEPAPAASRLRRAAGPASIVAVLGVATTALALRDPHQQGSWGLCPSAALLGIDCPGCGGLRAVNDLTHLRLLDAASSNLVLVLTIPVVVFFLGRWLLDSWRGVRRRPGFFSRHAVPLAGAFFVALVVFTVLRNLPAGAWLAA